MNPLDTVLTDAERLAERLIPPAAHIDRVVGAIIARLADTAGTELASLTDAALGREPETTSTETQTTATPVATNTETIADLEAKLSKLKSARASEAEAGAADAAKRTQLENEIKAEENK